MLDRTEQRIIGVLIEKELAVPDSYPMTENALLAGCNQKSNREPEMSLEDFELAGALMALREKGWVVKVEGSRADRYRHDIAGRLGIDDREKAVLCELLVRGPQAPGALKPRVARMGFSGSPEEVLAVLEAMRDRGRPLAEQQARRPRERDQRWAHCLGPAAEEHVAEAAEAGAEMPAPAMPTSLVPAPATPTAAPVPMARPESDIADLETRVAQLESEIGLLTEAVAELRAQLGQGGGADA